MSTSATYFALVLMLRGADRRDAILGLLSDQRREEVECVLHDVGQIPNEQILQNLRKHRSVELEAQRALAEERTGIKFEHLPSKLITWLSRPF